MFLADGGKSVEALLAPTQEPFRPEMKRYEEATELGTHSMWQLHLERSDLQKKYLDQWMLYGDLDAILGGSPAFELYAELTCFISTDDALLDC